jgi:hypothetical protein
LLLFAGLLLFILLRGVSRVVADYTRLGRSASVTLAVLVVTVFGVLAVWLAADQISGTGEPPRGTVATSSKTRSRFSTTPVISLASSPYTDLRVHLAEPATEAYELGE